MNKFNEVTIGNEDVDNYLDLSNKLKVVKNKIEPRIKELANIYSGLNNDAFNYIENWYIEGDFVYIEITGYRFGEISSYYEVPMKYLYDNRAYEKIESDIRILKQKEHEKYQREKLEEQRQEYEMLKEKFEK